MYRTPVTGTFAGSSVQERKKKGEGVRGNRLHWRVQKSTSNPTGVGSKQRRVFEVLWNLECPVGLSQREIGYVCISMKKERRKCFI